MRLTLEPAGRHRSARRGVRRRRRGSGACARRNRRRRWPIDVEVVAPRPDPVADSAPRPRRRRRIRRAAAPRAHAPRRVREVALVDNSGSVLALAARSADREAPARLRGRAAALEGAGRRRRSTAVQATSERGSGGLGPAALPQQSQARLPDPQPPPTRGGDRPAQRPGPARRNTGRHLSQPQLRAPAARSRGARRCPPLDLRAGPRRWRAGRQPGRHSGAVLARRPLKTGSGGRASVAQLLGQIALATDVARPA